MITKDWKVSQVLDLYPETLDVFLEVSRHFSKLKNKVLRRTLARRVTLEQAARVGGVDVQKLLMKLNLKAGFDVSDISRGDSQSPETAGKFTSGDYNTSQNQPLPDRSEIMLDVRPIIESGTDPFKAIMKTVKEMRADEMLHLVNSFEPVPLYSVMERKGYTHASEKQGSEWHIWFWKKEETDRQPDTGYATPSGMGIKEEGKIVQIDVRGLEPPQPMVTILEKLNQIGENTTLLVHHHREPVLLYDKLEELGYEATTNKIEENYYKVSIKRKDTDNPD
jgi:uncharacterized protein (DUF2249 family)